MVKIKNLNLEIYGIIYLIKNKVNGKCYVGQTQKEKGFNGRYKPSGEGIEKVYKYHKSKKKYNENYNKHLLRSIEKYGFEAFEVNECLDYAFSLEELNIKEKVYIQLYDSFKNGYNDTEGGEGVKGYIPSEETRQKMSEVMKGENNPMYGKHFSEEHRQKLSEAKKGHSLSEEVKQKIGEANKGKHHTKETRQKISEAKKGKNNPNYGKHHAEETIKKLSKASEGENNPNAKAVYCYEKNEIRLTAKEWSEELCISGVGISNCCTGKLKSTGGHHFRYATEEEIKEYKQKKLLTNK